MSAKKKRKACFKAKREKEILHDLDVLNRRIDWLDDNMIALEATGQATRARNEMASYVRVAHELTKELNELWTMPPIKKRRALHRTGPL